MRKKSPTQSSLALLRKLGYTAQVVEHWNPHARRRIDLFGFGDILAIRENEIVIVQTTSGTNLAARRRKITQLRAHSEWLAAGGLIELHGWRYVKPRGESKRRWEPRIVRWPDRGS